jgi:hypothetical protein
VLSNTVTYCPRLHLFIPDRLLRIGSHFTVRAPLLMPPTGIWIVGAELVGLWRQ